MILRPAMGQLRWSLRENTIRGRFEERKIGHEFLLQLKLLCHTIILYAVDFLYFSRVMHTSQHLNKIYAFTGIFTNNILYAA